VSIEDLVTLYKNLTWKEPTTEELAEGKKMLSDEE
jgi:hypothetical protein